ncbi:MAG: hypothetical protein O3B87_02900 [bacterium]|nr:hypothetical protein [bacterium]
MSNKSVIYEPVVKKAKESCKNSNQTIQEHFVDITDMIELGNNASREIIEESHVIPDPDRGSSLDSRFHGNDICLDTSPAKLGQYDNHNAEHRRIRS